MKKNLLNESTIRRFMKLANVDVLASNFIDEGGYNFDRDDEEEEEEGFPPAPEGGEPEMDMGDVEPGPELDVAPEGGGEVESVVKDVMSTIAQALNDKFGDEGLEINLDAGEEELGGEEGLDDLADAKLRRSY